MTSGYQQFFLADIVRSKLRWMEKAAQIESLWTSNLWAAMIMALVAITPNDWHDGQAWLLCAVFGLCFVIGFIRAILHDRKMPKITPLTVGAPTLTVTEGTPE